MSKHKLKWMIIDILFLILLIALDQITKYLAVVKLKDQEPFEIINKVFELHYLENSGAAFGMLQNQKIFFIFVAVAILFIISYVLFKTPDHKKYNVLHLSLIMIASGAIGNMIDRIRYDYVVDFFYFKLINFPIFNVADIYVTVATVLIVLIIIFVYKEDDFSFLNMKQKRYRQIK